MQRRHFAQQRPRPDWFLAGSIGLVALLVVFLAVMPGLVVRSVLARDTILTQRIDPMSTSAAAIVSILVDQEASERGYIITANESFLVPYADSSTRLNRLWPVAESQANALGQRAPELLASVRRSAAAWQTQAAEAEIADVRSGYQEDAASAVASGRSQVLFDQFRRDSDSLAGYLQGLRATQTAARDSDLSRLDVAVNVLVALGLIALGLLLYAGARYISLLRRVVLAESEARFRNIVETANEGVWLIDRQTRTLVANQRMSQLLQTQPEVLEGASILDFCFEEDLSEAQTHVRQNLHGRSEQFDFRFHRSDGTPLLVLACTSPVRDAGGAVIGALGMFSDITARKQAEAERAELLLSVQEARDAAEAAHSRLSLLAAASQRLAEAGNNLNAVVSTAACETGRALGDACVLLLASDDRRELTPAALYHRDAGILTELVRDLGEPQGVDRGLNGKVLETGNPVRIDGVASEELKPPDESAQLPVRQGVRVYSRLIVPVHAGGRAIGTLDAMRTSPGRPYTADDEVLLQELADRTGLAIENARLYRDAVEALETRDEFLSTITHDLRSPLTTVRGFTQIMLRRLSRRETMDPERATAWLTTIEKSSERIMLMINELLDLAQLRNGRPLNLNTRHMDLVALARQLAEEEQQSTDRHAIRFEANPLEVYGYWDPVRLGRVLVNLLSNAVKYSPDGGNITVRVEARPEGLGKCWAEVRVGDEGVGIPPADLSRVFERFHRGANVGGIGGLGLGLAAARQIAEQHGGTLTAESELGKGSVFMIRLPIEEAAPDGSTSPQADGEQRVPPQSRELSR
jgi:PAS domain S-box-containing protein